MMPRSPLALVAVLLAAAPIHAQSAGATASRPRFGIVGGANLSSMTETRDARRLTGAYVGAQLVLPRNALFSIQLEAAWSQKGVRATGTDIDSGERVDFTLRNGYVELPILVRLDSPFAIGVRPVGAIPFVVVGPALGVSVSCTIDAQSAEGPVSYDCDDDFGVKTFEFGAMLGAGLDALIGTRTLSLGARYTMGLQDVFDGGSGRNRAVVLVAGVSF
jgi:hypothetical protein